MVLRVRAGAPGVSGVLVVCSPFEADGDAGFGFGESSREGVAVGVGGAGGDSCSSAGCTAAFGDGYGNSVLIGAKTERWSSGNTGKIQ